MVSIPRPGPLWGVYPQRVAAGASAASAASGWLHDLPAWAQSWAWARQDRQRMQAVRAEMARIPSLHAEMARIASPHAEMARIPSLHAEMARMAASPAAMSPLAAARARLARTGLTPEATVPALALVARVLEHTLNVALYDTQIQAACVLLDNRLAEMATGEGKTYAVAAAAAVAALAGVPVHVVTANDYLAARDAQALAPLYTALGLSVGAIAAEDSADMRRATYGCGVVYVTAKELAFDYLRDSLLPGARDPGAPAGLLQHAAALAGRPSAQPVLRGLCMAILDEADSILLDEACVPLVLSQAAPHAARRAFLWQALAVARQLGPDDHHCDAGGQHEQLSAAGRERVQRLTAALGGPWRKPRYRIDAIHTALTALHRMRRDHDYLVREGRIELLDDITGRIARGRVWSRGLQTAVELKEGCALSADTETVAQITFQRFFRCYVRLSGLSGTLREARGELRAVYGLGVVQVPPRRPSRREHGPTRLFADADALWQACTRRIAALRDQGRAVLVGTDSVEDSEQLSARLSAAGIAHRVLNARHDRDEAAIVAQAGGCGCVTVATRMAGRGTDIPLSDAVIRAGGLHVLACQHNASPRQDRQLWGRSARQGDPGSVELWLTHRWAQVPPGSWTGRLLQAALTCWPALPLRLTQWWAERRATQLRRRLLEQDRLWERRQQMPRA